ncbi:MAG: hypothetical protein H7177_10445 [Rhizobacter sp.]|nr:hypothetical protein [Bacteriovorax sp.]
MKKSLLIGSAILSMSLSTLSFACDSSGKTGFLPANNMKIFAGDKAANSMTEEKFNAITERVASTYKAIIAAKGATLFMNNAWEDPTVNASAQESGSQWQINMYGGLARHPLTTDDGFMMVVCHELGHHLGGAPRYDHNTDWAANEGQADYFAGLKCMRRVLQNDDNIAIVAKMTIDAEAVKQCSSIYKSESDIALCERVSMAGKSLGSLLGELGGNSNVNFTTPDKKVVKTTNDAHPAAQCRLDTYFQSTLCDKSMDEELSKDSPIPGACIKKDGYAKGPRPLCWYKPTSAEI